MTRPPEVVPEASPSRLAVGLVLLVACLVRLGPLVVTAADPGLALAADSEEYRQQLKPILAVYAVHRQLLFEREEQR